MEYSGYIQNHFTVTQPLSEYLWRLTEGLHAHTRRLYFHIVATTVLRIRKDRRRWIPVGSALMHDKISRAKWRDLVKRGILENTGYLRPTDDKPGESRNFRITDTVWDEIVSIYLMPDEEYRRLARFDLFQNKPLKKNATTKMWDDNRNTLSPTWRAAMKTVGRVIFNEAQILQGLEGRREQVSRLKGIVDRPDAAERQRKAYNRALGRLLNDEHCYESVQQQQYRDEGNGYASYVPAYGCKKTGRATAIGGGLQSCTKLMKRWAYTGLERFYRAFLKSRHQSGKLEK